MVDHPFVGVCCALVALSSAAPASAELPRAFIRGFRLRIEQDGRLQRAVKGRVLLKARPFTIELTMPKRRAGVMVNVSLSPDLARAARAGRPLDRRPPLGEGSGMAEHDFNPDNSLWASDQGSHYLFWTARRHRFNRVIVGRASIIGRRDVKKIVAIDQRPQQSWPIHQLAGKRLYLVLLRSDGSGKPERGERWRATLELYIAR